ncbi:MAG: 3-oxoacyl-[acyl-carrier-protein] reductase [Firmicutes bacterium]|jgi:3-oxoacyl-[acyl-carrier protein] reductase|nr:3-oxoacyl-[acyl-carrier-protein] reductase [Bacillota bacterium]
MKLTEKVALVTGGSRGIGRSIVLSLAAEGAKVAINYIGDDAEAKEVLEEVKALGSDGMIVHADISKSEDVDAMVKEVVKTMGTIDILINNAGITKDGLVLRMKEEDFNAVIDINLKGTFLTSKVVGKHMLKKRTGKIVNISSVVGIMGNAGQANYSASKAGVIGLTKSMAKEFASRGVNVNAVAPGFIETKMTDKLTDEVKESYSKVIPLGKMGSAEDVAKAVTFLSTEDSDYITGQVINVCGGMVM